MVYHHLSLEKENGVGTICLNRPPANALNLALGLELNTVLDEVAAAPEIKVVVFASAINMFIAGADIKMIQEVTTTEFAHFIDVLQQVNLKIEQMPKICIAAINGHALGGGCELTLACDFRFMARGKARIGLPEIQLGILPGAGGTQRLTQIVGKGKAMEMLITGEPLNADQALAAGLVHRALGPEELMPATKTFARTLAQKATMATGMIKACVQQSVNTALENGLAFEVEAIRQLFTTEDAQEGIAAFVEKRPARFQGR
jgi:enoyl-CoA hydratase